MISPKEFTTILIKNNLGPVIEVPCSYLKSFLNYGAQSKALEIINPVNEALAMGIASGSYLATNKIPIVAIQNSGFTNTLNALTSLNQIYLIPVFYLITWRGEGKDAPEHAITGKKMQKMLQTFDLPYEIIDQKTYPQQIKTLAKLSVKTKKPVALIITKNTFTDFEHTTEKQEFEMTRFEAIEIIKNNLSKNTVFISSTGFPTRDSFMAKNTPDFYMVGSMGHTFSLALGIAPHTQKTVVVLDGDGSSLMHVGGLASFDPRKHKNIIYIILDNKRYESTGGQPTLSARVDFMALAKAFHFTNFYQAVTKLQLKNVLKKLKPKEPAFIHIKMNTSPDKKSKRVSDTYTTVQIKEEFMKKVIS